MAGDTARARYANLKAAEYYERGLELLGDSDVVRRIDALHHWGDVLQLAGDNDRARAAFEAMLEIAFRLDLKAKGGAAHNRIGRVYRAIGQLDEAMRHLGTGHALFEAAGDVRGVASSLDDVGKVHWMRGNYEAAERFMKQGLEVRGALGDARSIALSHNNLGLVYQDSGRFSEAQVAFQEALSLRQEIGDKPGIAQTLNNLGTIHQDNGEHERAVELYRDALIVASQVGDRMRQAVILTNLGESEYRLERPTEAIRVLKQAEDLSATLGDTILEGEILRGLAKAHMLVHDIKLAREYVLRSVELFEESRGKPFLGVALRTQAEILAAAGWGGDDHRLAKDSWERSLRIFEELGNDVELANTCGSYANFLSANPDAKSDPVLAHEAMTMRGRADEIRERLRASEDYELAPLPGETTTPSGQMQAAGAETSSHGGEGDDASGGSSG
jgi:tetratricopeptide (TPR) repeat protein